jgi:hypothetical protein
MWSTQLFIPEVHIPQTVTRTVSFFLMTIVNVLTCSYLPVFLISTVWMYFIPTTLLLDCSRTLLVTAEPAKSSPCEEGWTDSKQNTELSAPPQPGTETNFTLLCAGINSQLHEHQVAGAASYAINIRLSIVKLSGCEK